jgi:hypothetical protein
MPTISFARGHRAAWLRFAALLLVAGMGPLACSDDPSGPSREFGTYTLVRVNNQTLPFAITTASGNMVVQTGSLVLSDAPSGNPLYSATVNGTDDGVAGIILVDGGQYTINGTTLTFTSSLAQGVVYPGTATGNAVTITIPGAVIGAAGTLVLRLEK